MSKLISEGFAAWRECRQAFDELLHAQYQLAEERTNGVLLNERGRQAGIDPWRLFTSNQLFRNAYASEELQDHWRDHPHQTFASFESQWPSSEEPEAKPVCAHCGKPVVEREMFPGTKDWAHEPDEHGDSYWQCRYGGDSLSKTFAEVAF